MTDKKILSGPVTLTSASGHIPAGATGTARDPQRFTEYSSEPVAWVFWDDKTHYPRWVAASKLAQG